jgi:hypothetical protein
VSDASTALIGRFLVELPEIEPAPKIGVSCGNAEFKHAKRRKPTRNVNRPGFDSGFIVEGIAGWDAWV